MTAETVTTRKTIQRRTKSSKSKARKKKNASVRPGATKPAIARPDVGSETPTMLGYKTESSPSGPTLEELLEESWGKK